MCKMVPFVQSTAVVTEILTLTCIAVERHQGLVRPFRTKRQRTARRAFAELGKAPGASPPALAAVRRVRARGPAFGHGSASGWGGI